MIICLPKLWVNVLNENAEYVKKNSNHDRFASLLFLCLGGQDINADLIVRSKKQMKSLICCVSAYASTECSMISTGLVMLSSFKPDKYRTLLGQPYAYVECKIVNLTNGEIQPLNVEGELHVRSPGVTPGYWNDPEITRESKDSNGWLIIIS